MEDAMDVADMRPTKEEIFFGTNPRGFIDDVCNMIDEYIADGIETLDQQLEVNLKGQLVPSKVHNSCGKLHDSMKKVCDSNFDKFELYMLRNILNVPDPVDVSDLEPVDMEDDSREEELEIDAMLEKLRQQISEVKSENRILKTGIRKAKFQLSQGRAAAKKIEFLKEVACTNSETVSAILSQNAALKPMLARGAAIVHRMSGETSAKGPENDDNPFDLLKEQMNVESLKRINEMPCSRLTVS